MAPPRVPPQAFECEQQKLKAFRNRISSIEWKAFEIVNADEQSMSFESVNKMEVKLLAIMETSVRLPCIVCQSHQDVVYCSITYTSSLSTKERMSHSRFKPTFYFVVFPNESIFYTTKRTIPDIISESLLKFYGATRLNRLPLEGKDFRSLRQLHFNKENKGMLCRRPVEDSHPLDYTSDVEDVEMSEAVSSSDAKDDVIEDEDVPWRKKKNEYFSRHFYPKKDPTITKFSVSSNSKFSVPGSSKKLDCNMKVTFHSKNLIDFFDHAMDKGILSYPLNPFLQNVVNLGKTSVSTNAQEE